MKRDTRNWKRETGRPLNISSPRGYTLIELVVAVGIFALVMTLASGAYLLVIDLNRQAQGVTTGINNLSFVLETMTRSIRTGTSYGCELGGDCQSGGDSFSFKDADGTSVTYARGAQGQGGSIGTVTKNGSTILTDPSVNISALTFYVSGTDTVASGDYAQPHVTIVISGAVTSGPGEAPQPFTIQTGATMRGVDLNVVSAPVENPPLPTCTLSTDSTSVHTGGSALLSWQNTNATSFSIEGVSVTPASQSTNPHPVTPSETTTYTGTVTNDAGSNTCTVTITVTPQE